MRYTSQWVERNSHGLGAGRIESRCTPLPLCRCGFCGGRFRVLPVEIAPLKSYTRPVIETACAAYTDPDLPGLSLEKTVGCLGGGHPHRSALHGWLGGLGARALGRLDSGPAGPPVSALLAESATPGQADLLSRWAEPVAVAARKYRSPRRRDQLQACARLFAMAQRLFPRHPHAWGAWELWLQSRFHVTAWGFPSRFRSTAIQQHGPRRLTIECAPSFRDLPAATAAAQAGPKRRKKGNAHGARSPP